MKTLFENITIRQTVLKNTFWLTISQIVSRLVRAIIIIYAARALGTASWGAFSYVLSLAGLCTLFADSGLYALLVREWSRNKEKGQELFPIALRLKFILLLLSLILFFITFFLTPSMEKKGALFITIAIITLFDSLRDFCLAIPRAQERFEIEAGIQIISGILLVLFALCLFFVLPHTTLTLGIAYAASSFLAFIICARALHTLFLNWRKKITPTVLIQTLKKALPLGIFGLLGIITLNTDTILLGTLKSLDDTGLYAAVQRIIQFFLIIPGLFVGPLFPLLSRFALKDTDHSQIILTYGIYLTVIMATPIAIDSILFGEIITRTLYGQAYTSAGTSFQILGASLLFAFPWMMLSTFAVAIHDTKAIIQASLIGIFMNALLDVVLIPLLGINGAALSTFITTILMTSYIFFVLKKYFNRESWLLFLRPLIAGTIIVVYSLGMLTLTRVSSLFVLMSGLFGYGFLLLASKDPLVKILKGGYKW